VIPTSNRSALLARAIESVRGQTYDKLEIIVVDDASTDDTATVVRSIGDNRIRYMRHPCKQGGAAARNTGIRAAAGEYIAFLDDDDQWEPEKIVVQLASLGGCDAVLCMSTIGSDYNVARLSERKICTLAELRRGMPPVGGTSALMARADILKDLLFDEELPRCQDWDLLIRLADRCSIRYVGRRLVRYNDGDHSRITNAAIKAKSSKAEFEKTLAFFKKHAAFFGPRWFRIHVSRALLYGVRHREHPLRHILEAVRQCGVMPVLRALSRRIYQMLSGNV
jgi:glycosyltransferase involved in cell wall biosynthesis